MSAAYQKSDRSLLPYKDKKRNSDIEFSVIRDGPICRDKITFSSRDDIYTAKVNRVCFYGVLGFTVADM